MSNSGSPPGTLNPGGAHRIAMSRRLALGFHPSLSLEFRDPIERRKRAFDQMFEINKRSWVLRRYASR